MSENSTTKTSSKMGENQIHGFTEIEDAISKAIKAMTKKSSESDNVKRFHNSKAS